MEAALDEAALHLKQKMEKKHKKSVHKNSLTAIINKKKNEHAPEHTDNPDDCTHCSQIKDELKVGRSSPIIGSPTTSMRQMRRQGVSQRNPTEGALVQEAMKVATITESLQSIGALDLSFLREDQGFGADDDHPAIEDFGANDDLPAVEGIGTNDDQPAIATSIIVNNIPSS